MVSRKALVRSSSRRSATDAIVFRNRMTLGVIGIEQAFRRRSLHHLGQLPSQVHCILHAGLEALSAIRRMYVCGIAGQQHPSLAIGRSLPGRIGEPGNRSRAVDAIVGPVYGNERLAEIVQRRFSRLSNVPFR
jgi:hypothetical protein